MLFDCFNEIIHVCLNHCLENVSQLIFRGNWNNHLCFFSSKDTSNIFLMFSDQFTLKRKGVRIKWIRCSYQYSFFRIKIFGIWYFHEHDFVQYKTQKQNSKQRDKWNKLLVNFPNKEKKSTSFLLHKLIHNNLIQMKS